MKRYSLILLLVLSPFLLKSQVTELSSAEMKEFMKKEAHRTEPDYLCFVPESYDYRSNDSHNEHFLVFDGPDGAMPKSPYSDPTGQLPDEWIVWQNPERAPDGKYFVFHHNSSGNLEIPGSIHKPRNPAYIALGEFRPEADQPIWFSESKLFLDNGNTGPDRKVDGMGNLAVYTSFTKRNGKNILWYPDSKCWLLGKEISAEFLESLKVP